MLQVSGFPGNTVSTLSTGLTKEALRLAHPDSALAHLDDVVITLAGGMLAYHSDGIDTTLESQAVCDKTVLKVYLKPGFFSEVELEDPFDLELKHAERSPPQSSEYLVPKATTIPCRFTLCCHIPESELEEPPGVHSELK